MADWLNAQMVIFLFTTLVLGGGAAWLTGRAIALTWQPLFMAWVWMVLLAAAVRFIHFSLFHNSLIALDAYLLDYFIVASASSFGYALTRKRQMAVQYNAWRQH